MELHLASYRSQNRFRRDNFKDQKIATLLHRFGGFPAFFLKTIQG